MQNKNEDTEQKIAAWKEKYGAVYSYEVENDKGEIVTAFFKRPERRIVSAAQAELVRGNVMKYNETILKNSLLEGAGEILSDDSLFYGLSQKVDEIVGARVGELKKL